MVFLLYMMFLLTSISSGTTETRAMFRKPPAVKGRMYLEKTYHSRKSWFHGELFVQYKYKCTIFLYEQGLQIIAALEGERHEGPQQADQGRADLGSGSLAPGFCLVFIGSSISLEYVPMFVFLAPVKTWLQQDGKITKLMGNLQIQNYLIEHCPCWSKTSYWSNAR